MKINIHDCNLQQVWACLNGGYNEVWLHGDGNIFPVLVYDPLNPNAQDGSKTHSENFDKTHAEKAYRVKINRANMPKSVEQATRMLERAFSQDENQKANEAITKNSPTLNIRMSDTDFRDDIIEPTGEIDYSKFNKSNA